jgi:hypothetical protein
MECEKMKAKNREEFISCWEEEFDVLAMLSESLPMSSKPNIALEYLGKLRELRLRYIALAANDTYGARFCRYCEHMKDQSNGKTDAQALGSYCELDLVKQETGDLTAATCEKYANWEILLARRKEQEAKGEISEEEHIEQAAAALKTLSQVKGVTVSQESKPKRVKPMRLEMHKRQEPSQ